MKDNLKYTTVENNFPKMIFRKQKALSRYGKSAVERSLQAARAKVVANTPVDTSRLVNSIQGNELVPGDSIFEIKEDGLSTGIKITGTLGTNVPYAARIEFGFKGKDKLGRVFNQSGQFYFTKGFQQAKENIKQITKATLMGR